MRGLLPAVAHASALHSGLNSMWRGLFLIRGVADSCALSAC